MQSTGHRGELIAAQYLAAKGFAIVQYNYRSQFGEIDLVVRSDEYLVFVEVKLRKSERFGTPAEMVNKTKQRRLRATAGLYLQQNATELQPRFDVVEIIAPRGPEERLSVRHIENAF